MTLEKGIEKLKGIIQILQEELDESKNIKMSTKMFQEIHEKFTESEEKRLNMLKKLLEIFEAK